MTSDRLPMRWKRLLVVAAIMSPCTAVQAEAEESEPGQVISLTPEQKREALEGGGGATIGHRSLVAPEGSGSSRQIHGEVGAMIGTGGARGIYGAAAVPLGDNAGAFLSFEKTRFGKGSGWAPVCSSPLCRYGVMEEPR